MSTLRIALCLPVALMLVASLAMAAPVDDPDERTIGTLKWHTDYATAYRAAERDGKLLFILFRDETRPHVGDKYENEVLTADGLVSPLSNVVRAVLPLDTLAPATLPAMEAGKRLIDHEAFEHMQGQQGVAVLDLVDPDDELYGTVVSAHAFAKDTHYTTAATKIVLELPRGSITQRTLIYALRIHPEHPRSATGEATPYLLDQATRSSLLMMRSGTIGHINWGQRYAEMTAALNGRVAFSEVAAMGFGGNIVDAAHGCVRTWRGSPTHWGMMSMQTTIFGYDMIRGANGSWYATGILGR